MMPYKSKEQAKEATKERVRRYRESLKSNVTPCNVTPGVTPDVTPVMLTRPNRMGSNGLPEMVSNEYNPNEKLYNNPHYPDGTNRYLGPFSDGQCLDRTTVNAVK